MPLVSRLLLFAALSPAIPFVVHASDLILPSSTLERTGPVQLKYRMPWAATGEAKVHLQWADSLGRTVEDRQFTVQLVDEIEFHFAIDTRRAVAMKNHLAVHLSLDGKDRAGKADHRDEDVAADFIARPEDADWRDYQIIMWQQYPAGLQPALQKLGITGGQYSGRATQPPDFLLNHNLRWYAENIATEFYSEYHRWRPDRIQHWSFLQAKELYKKNPESLEAFKRHPSFWDPEWRKDVHDRLVASAQRNTPYRPFFYSLGDETGIADLAAFWDFDFSDHSLDQMRRWLRREYGTLGALNAAWGTQFETWDLVTPPTTHQAMQRTDDNYTAWADFKTWMDISFSDALKMGADAVHEVDPAAYVSIGGGQIPSWGGYDYSRITKALTSIEPYDIGSNIEIIRSLAPSMPMVTTGFASGPWERQRVWMELFHGNRGLIIWDEKQEYVDKSGTPGQRGKDAGEYYNEIRNGIGALIINSTPVTDPIAIHYSQPSMRTEWMLARRGEGDAWMTRNAKQERTDNEFMRIRESWCRLIEDQGLQYRFVSYDQMEQGELFRGGYRVLVLPRSSALSHAEADAIRRFVEQGGTVIADGKPGTFNEHSRRLAEPQLNDLFGDKGKEPFATRHVGQGQAISLFTDTLNYHQNRLVKKEAPVQRMVGGLLRSQGIEPEFAVVDASGQPVAGVETHVFRNGGVSLVALSSNPQLRVDELGPPDFRSNERFEQPVSFELKLPATLNVYDVRARRHLGVVQKLKLTLNPYEPIVLAVTAQPLPAMQVNAPASAARGSLAEIAMFNTNSVAAHHVYHVDVFSPSGERMLNYSGNAIGEQGRAVLRVPFAVNDPAGEWKLSVHDLLTGKIEERKLQLQ